jgi:hypothetical protein
MASISMEYPVYKCRQQEQQSLQKEKNNEEISEYSSEESLLENQYLNKDEGINFIVISENEGH